MPKVKLVFDLEKKEDVIYYNRANKASDMSNALFEISSLNETINYDEKMNDDIRDGAKLALTEVIKIIQKYDINFNSMFIFEPNKELLVEDSPVGESIISLINDKFKNK